MLRSLSTLFNRSRRSYSSVLVFDTETTGLPKMKGFNNYYSPSDIHKYDESRIVELGWLLCSKEGDILRKNSFFVQPDGFIIKNSHIHGITNKIVRKIGIPLDVGIEEFYDDLLESDTIVCHNMNFDRNILLSECYRRNLDCVTDEIGDKVHVCTWQMAQKYFSRNKGNTLENIYMDLFDEPLKNSHRALTDATATAECYFKMI